MLPSTFANRAVQGKRNRVGLDQEAGFGLPRRARAVHASAIAKCEDEMPHLTLRRSYLHPFYHEELRHIPPSQFRHFDRGHLARVPHALSRPNPGHLLKQRLTTARNFSTAAIARYHLFNQRKRPHLFCGIVKCDALDKLKADFIRGNCKLRAGD